MNTEEALRHFIDVAEPANKRTPYAVLSDPSDVSSAVVRFELGGDEALGSAALTTNDTLTTIWASPSGSLWLGSARARIWTTAPVAWDAKQIRGLEWQGSDPDFTWKALELPSPGTVTALFGSSDRDVHAATAEGGILHWDGAEWRPRFGENDRAIAHMHGTGSDSVWAVGDAGLLLHFDGRSWQRQTLPGKSAQERLTGVWATAEHVYVCSAGGALWSGDRTGFTQVGSFPFTFHGLVECKGTLYLAGGDDGVCVLRGKKVEVERDSLFAIGVYPLNERLAFLQALQDPPAIVIHDPSREEDEGWLACFWD